MSLGMYILLMRDHLKGDMGHGTWDMGHNHFLKIRSPCNRSTFVSENVSAVSAVVPGVRAPLGHNFLRVYAF